MNSYNAQLVGVNFRPAEAKEIVKALEIGNGLALEREPENEYDPNAVKVIYCDDDGDGTETFVGYIERGIAAIIAPQLDEGHSFTVTVDTRLSPLSVLLHLEAEPEA